MCRYLNPYSQYGHINDHTYTVLVPAQYKYRTGRYLYGTSTTLSSTAVTRELVRYLLIEISSRTESQTADSTVYS